MFKKSSVALSCACATLLSACGGGGGGGSTVNTAEGLWQGTSSSGANVTVAVLENGEAWGGATVGNALVSALAGTASGNGTAFSASGSEFYFASNSVSSGSYSGTVNQRQRIQATSSNGGTIDLAYNPYYDQPVTAADIAGNYTLSGRTARYSISNLSLTISANGSFSIVDGGCTTTGNASPRSASKSIVNVSATGSGTCALGNGVTLSGIALLDKSATPNSLYVIALNSAKSDGLVLIGRKN